MLLQIQHLPTPILYLKKRRKLREKRDSAAATLAIEGGPLVYAIFPGPPQYSAHPATLALEGGTLHGPVSGPAQTSTGQASLALEGGSLHGPVIGPPQLNATTATLSLEGGNVYPAIYYAHPEQWNSVQIALLGGTLS